MTCGVEAKTREYILFRSSEGRERNGKVWASVAISPSSSEGYAEG